MIVAITISLANAIIVIPHIQCGVLIISMCRCPVPSACSSVVQTFWLILMSRALARDVLKKLRFSDFMKYPKLRSLARQLEFCEPLNIFVSSQIALSLETSSQNERFYIHD